MVYDRASDYTDHDHNLQLFYVGKFSGFSNFLVNSKTIRNKKMCCVPFKTIVDAKLPWRCSDTLYYSYTSPHLLLYSFRAALFHPFTFKLTLFRVYVIWVCGATRAWRHEDTYFAMLPYQVKSQYLHFRFHANYFLLPWKIAGDFSRRSTLFH